MEIKIKDLGKKYEGNKAYTLVDLNAEIKSGDFAVLLGPSGSGKTTLLRMIAGLNSITKGDLLFDNRRVNELSPKDRDIAMVFQSYALYPHMNVYDNIAFGLKLAKTKKTLINRKVKDVAKILDIEEFLYSKPADLSGGQRQRVALGRAIARKPAIFLMDEPLSNLDAKLREKMRVELVRIHNMMNTTTIYVTHDQLEAMTMATKIILINEQQIVQIGTPDQIYNKPNSIFAAKFIGTPSMNMIPGYIKDDHFVSDDGNIKVKPLKKHLDYFKKFGVEKLILGIRPKDIKVNAKSKAKPDFSKDIAIDVIENLGATLLLTLKVTHSLDITVSIDNSYLNNFKSGDNINVSAESSTFHFFDQDSNQRITENFEELKDKWNKHKAFLNEQNKLNEKKKRFFLKKKTSEQIKKDDEKRKNRIS